MRRRWNLFYRGERHCYDHSTIGSVDPRKHDDNHSRYDDDPADDCAFDRRYSKYRSTARTRSERRARSDIAPY
jgi:hypothetical protein